MQEIHDGQGHVLVKVHFYEKATTDGITTRPDPKWMLNDYANLIPPRLKGHRCVMCRTAP